VSAEPLKFAAFPVYGYGTPLATGKGMSRSLRFVFVSSLALTACATHTVSTPTPRPVSVTPPASSTPEPVPAPVSVIASGSYLVWTSDADGTARPAPAETHWLVADGSGLVEAGRVSGVLVAAEGHIFRFDTEQTPVATTSCEGLYGPGTGPAQNGDPGSATHAFVERLDDGRRSDVVLPPDTDGVASFEHWVGVVGSVGPYLFVVDHTYDYACGAHGSVGAGFRVFDVGAGREVELLDAREHERVDTVEKSEASARFNESGNDGSSKRPDELAFAYFRPSFNPAGALELDVVFATDVCYACSSGDWASYTSTVSTPAHPLPHALDPWSRPPPELGRALAALGPAALRGWSKVEGTDAQGRVLAKVFDAP
jgi:hypothetical protein